MFEHAGVSKLRGTYPDRLDGKAVIKKDKWHFNISFAVNVSHSLLYLPNKLNIRG